MPTSEIPLRERVRRTCTEAELLIANSKKPRVQAKGLISTLSGFVKRASRSEKVLGGRDSNPGA